MVFLTLLILAIIGIVAFFYSQQKREERKGREAEVIRLAQRANDCFQKMESVKTTSSKINNCSKGLEFLKEAGKYPECRDIISNYDQMIEKAQSAKKVLPVIKYLKKSHRHNFKGKDSSEKNSLLDALYEIRTKSITNEDFEIAEAIDEETAELIRIENIENRLKELGWDG